MREFLQPISETLSLAMLRERPLAALKATLDDIHISGKIPFDQWIKMHKEGETEKLVIFCLPSMIASISRYLGYGVPEEDILAMGLFSTFEAVKNWHPVEEPVGQGDCLRGRVHQRAGQSVRRLIAKEHGLKKGRDFPVVEAFRTCFDEFVDRTGQRPTMREMVQAVEEALPGCQFETIFPQGKKASHRVEIIYRHVFKRGLPVCVPPSRISLEEMETRTEQKELITEFNALLILFLRTNKAGDTYLQVFSKKYLNGMDNQEIAYELGVTRERVRQRLGELMRELNHPVKSERLRELLRS